MSILKYSNKANPAASAKNVQYITRDSAADSISFHNLEELHNDDRTQAKSNAINYAERREIEEESRVRGNERGTPRNHNRMIISFDRKEETRAAKEEVHKFLEREFPNQRAVVSVHQDGDHTHAHVWMDCRDIDTDRKTQLKPKDFYSLDEKWAKQYDERYKTNYEREYKEKKAEIRGWKREQSELKREGKQPRPQSKPRRANDDKKRILKTKELKDYGIEKSAARTDKQLATRGHSAIRRSEQTLDNSERNLKRAADSAAGALREVTALHFGIERRNLEQQRSKERNGRDR